MDTIRHHVRVGVRCRRWLRTAAVAVVVGGGNRRNGMVDFRRRRTMKWLLATMAAIVLAVGSAVLVLHDGEQCTEQVQNSEERIRNDIRKLTDMRSTAGKLGSTDADGEYAAALVDLRRKFEALDARLSGLPTAWDVATTKGDGQ
jgi:hypothetical protein